MILIDTNWWVAYASHSDQHHDDAVAMHGALAPAAPLFTTRHILGETWTFMRRRAGHQAAVRTIDHIEQLAALAALTIDAVTADMEARAWTFLRQRAEPEFSFVDATSFEAMRARDAHEVLTFDSDFAAAGFVEVEPPRRRRSRRG